MKSLATNLVLNVTVTEFLQELSYRKHMAHQLRTQYVEGIYRTKYYIVTLKCRLRGHSRSRETEPLNRSYTTYY